MSKHNPDIIAFLRTSGISESDAITCADMAHHAVSSALDAFVRVLVTLDGPNAIITSAVATKMLEAQMKLLMDEQIDIARGKVVRNGG